MLPQTQNQHSNSDNFTSFVFLLKQTQVYYSDNSFSNPHELRRLHSVRIKSNQLLDKILRHFNNTLPLQATACNLFLFQKFIIQFIQILLRYEYRNGPIKARQFHISTYRNRKFFNEKMATKPLIISGAQFSVFILGLILSKRI